MGDLSTDEIDREISSRTKEVDTMSATLLELESHPGLAHVRRYAPTGVTAQRWAAVETALGQLWEDFGRLTSILDSARMVRARRNRPGDTERAELTQLLRGKPLEVSRERIPLGKRRITDPAEMVVSVGLADTVDRMRATYSTFATFLDAVDEIDTMIVERLAPTQKLLDKAGAAPPKELTDLLATSASDPLSLTTDDVHRRVALVERAVERRSAELAELAALRANWPDALASVATRLDELRDATQRAAEVRVRAEKTVLTSPLPSHPAAEPGLRSELEALTAQTITAPDIAALRALRRKVDAALAVVVQDDELARGLLERCSELKGRLSIYQAKAARLGLAEDRDLLASDQIATGLLSRRPCDLRAVTRAVADYRQLLLDKQGKTT